MTLHELYARLHERGDEEAARAARELAAAGRHVIVVSACLLGEKTRYDGGDKHAPAVVDPLLDDPEVAVLPLCPEILGGMGCPRPPIHYQTGDGESIERGARAVDDAGVDHTAALARGAARAGDLAALAGAGRAILKERSPSCGTRAVRGAFAARLARRGLPVLSDEDVLESLRPPCRPTRTT